MSAPGPLLRPTGYTYWSGLTGVLHIHVARGGFFRFRTSSSFSSLWYVGGQEVDRYWHRDTCPEVSPTRPREVQA